MGVLSRLRESDAPRYIIAFALVASLLTMTAMPAAASHPDTIVTSYSVHDTATELGWADTTNLSVDGSGTGAAIESGETVTYRVLDDAGDGAAEDSAALVGDTNADTTIGRSVKINPDTTGDISQLTINVNSFAGSDYGFVVDVYIIQENPDTNHGEGTIVANDWDPDFSTGDQTITLDSPYSVTAGTNYTVGFVTQSTDSDGTSDRIAISMDKDGGATDWFAGNSVLDWAADLDASIEIPALPAEYLGHHYVDNSTGGYANLTTMDNVSATLTWEADTNGDGTFDTQLAQQTGVTTTGNKSSTWAATDHVAVRLNVSVTSTGTAEAFEMADEVVRYDGLDKRPVASHTSTSDFNGATLTHMNVSGGTVQIGAYLDDGFEDEAADAGAPEDWTLEAGSSSDVEVVTSPVYEGSQAVEVDDSGSNLAISQSLPEPVTANLSFAVRGQSGSETTVYLFNAARTTSYITIGMVSGDLKYYDGTGFVTISTTPDVGDWVHLDMSFDPSTDTFDVTWTVQGGASGTSTGLTMRSSMPAEGYQSVQLSEFVGTGQYDSVYVPWPYSSGEYLNNHSVTNSIGGWANISAADNVSITATWEGDSNGDGTYDTALEQVSGITAPGNHTFTWDAFAGDDVRLNLTVESTGSDEAFVLEDEGVFDAPRSPTVNNSSADPSGGGIITSSEPTLSIDANDTDFPTAQGDTLTVEFFAAGTSQGTDTLTANGTASVTASNIDTGGTVTWNATVTDDAGHSVTSQDFTMEVPSTLQVRNATNESELITGQDVNATFYATDGVPIAERGTTDGNLSLANLPVGESFVVVVNTTNYHQRTIYIDDIFEQADIFLLNQSIPEAETVIEVTDNTGNYPIDESIIKVQRALNRSLFTPDEEDIRWITVTGETLGSDGSHTTHLEKYERYRVIVENQQGDQAVLGEFVAEFDSTRSFQIGSRTFDFTDQETGVEYGAEYDDSAGTTYVRFSLDDPNDNTSDVDVVIHERGNASNEIYNATSSGPFGSLSVAQPLTADQEDDEWVVDWEASNSGVDGDIGAEFGIGQSTRPLDIGDQPVQTAASVLTLLLTFFMTSAGLNRYAGAIITPMMGGFLWYLGLMPAEVGAGVIIFAMFLGGAYFASSSKAGAGF